MTTHSRTKNKLFEVINKSNFACAIVYQNGSIVFFNNRFVELFQDSFSPNDS